MTAATSGGPPECERPAPAKKPATATKPIAEPHHSAADYIAGLRRRRGAAWRLVPLDCGCADPWPCRCTQPPLSDAALDGWRAAAVHVLAEGQTPLLPIEVRRSLWRRGGSDRALAERLHRACAGVVA